MEKEQCIQTLMSAVPGLSVKVASRYTEKKWEELQEQESPDIGQFSAWYGDYRVSEALAGSEAKKQHENNEGGQYTTALEEIKKVQADLTARMDAKEREAAQRERVQDVLSRMPGASEFVRELIARTDLVRMDAKEFAAFTQAAAGAAKKEATQETRRALSGSPQVGRADVSTGDELTAEQVARIRTRHVGSDKQPF